MKQLEYSNLPLAAEVIRKSFATVAKEFGLTEQNCPNHTSFTTAEKLHTQFNLVWLMFGLYDYERLIGYVSLSRKNSLSHFTAAVEYLLFPVRRYAAVKLATFVLIERIDLR